MHSVFLQTFNPVGSMYGIFTNICPKNHPVLYVNIPYMDPMGMDVT